MANVTYSPNTRKQLVSMAEVSATAFIKTLAAEMFTDATSVENIEIMTEAIAKSLANLASESGCKDAILQVYALSILDETKVKVTQ